MLHAVCGVHNEKFAKDIFDIKSSSGLIRSCVHTMCSCVLAVACRRAEEPLEKGCYLRILHALNPFGAYLRKYIFLPAMRMRA